MKSVIPLYSIKNSYTPVPKKHYNNKRDNNFICKERRMLISIRCFVIFSLVFLYLYLINRNLNIYPIDQRLR